MKKSKLSMVARILVALLIGVVLWAACAVMQAKAEEQPIAIIYTDRYIYSLNEQDTEVGIVPGEDVSDTKDGNMDYADIILNTSPEAQFSRLLFDTGFMYISEIPLSFGEQKTIFTITHEAGIPWDMAMGIIDKETNGKFSISTVNHQSHDYGLWQINKRSWLGTARKLLGVKSMNDLLDVELNTKMGVYVLSDCMARYGGLNEKALIAYNAGWAKTSSNEYSRDVMARAEKWKTYMEENKREG